MKKLLFLVLVIICIPAVLVAKTLLYQGTLESEIAFTQQTGFTVDKPLNTMMFKFALPSSFQTKTVTQKITNLKIQFTPEPASVEDVQDAYGNRFQKVTWKDLRSDSNIKLTFNVAIKTTLGPMESKAAFPLTNIPAEEAVFLKGTKQVQVDAPEIVSLSKKLTAGAKTEFDAVNSIMNFVSDSIKYTYNPPQYDAVHTLQVGKGNCQNFAHLCMALLRASGIPARIVGGITLKDQWKVPAGSGRTLIQAMGQGGHAWLEIYFPDLGWLAYDPQQSKQFTSTRHIKQTHGLDSKDVNDSWKASPYLPKYEESMDGKFVKDDVSLNLQKSEEAPSSYLLSNVFVTGKPVAPAYKIEPPKVDLPKGKVIEFGNMEFPTLVALYQVSGDTATRILDKETAEYVTSKDIYAQEFTINDPAEVLSISLAMHKFGGDGAVYIDLLKEENGKPSLQGTRSDLVFLDKISRKPGYYWVEFPFSAENSILKKGRYWIVLRKSGEAIMNWFYIPGNAYGDSDDTRSTAKGWQWDDMLNYDFVFKVKAKRLESK